MVDEWKLPPSGSATQDEGYSYVEWHPDAAGEKDLTERELVRRECEAMVKYKAFSFSWDVFLHFLTLVFGYAWTVRAALKGRIPYSLATVFLVPLVHHSYMPLHECVHHNLAGCPRSGTPSKLAVLVQKAVGHICGFSVGVGFLPHRDDHMEHHKFTNHDSKDPNAQVFSGTFWHRLKEQLIFTVTGAIMLFFPLDIGAQNALKKDVGFNFEDGKLSKVGSLQKATMKSYLSIRRCALALALATGRWKAVFFLWWLPQQIGLFSVMMVFAWLPHHPHGDVGRYKDTRITLIGAAEPLRSLLSYLIFCGHDYHLLHHLYPRVPWTRLKRLYHDLEPVLKIRGARIEGGEGRPPVLLTAPMGKLKPVGGPFSEGHSERKGGRAPLLTDEELVKGSLQWIPHDQSGAAKCD